MRKTDGRLYILIATRIYYSYESRVLSTFPSFPFQDASFPSYSTLSLFRDIHFVPPCNDSDIFATDGRSWIYTQVYTLYVYISHGVQATLLRADVFVWSSFHWLRKKRGRVVKVQSVKRRVMIFRFNIFFLIFFLLFFLPLIVTLTSSRKIHITRVNLLFEIIYSLIEEFSEKKRAIMEYIENNIWNRKKLLKKKFIRGIFWPIIFF